MTVERYKSSSINLSMVMKDTNSPEYVRRLLQKLLTNNFLVGNFGMYLKDMSVKDLQELHNGLVKLKNMSSIEDKDIKYTLVFVYLAAFAEGAPSLSQEEVLEAYNLLWVFLGAKTAELNDQGTCIYENMHITGMSQWHFPFFIPKEPEVKNEPTPEKTI